MVALEKDMKAYANMMTDHGQQSAFIAHSVWWQACQNLLGHSANPVELTGNAMNQAKVLREAKETKNTFLTTIINSNRLWLSYLFGDYAKAFDLAASSRNIQQVAPGVFEVIEQAFYDGLTACAVMCTPSASKSKCKAIARKSIAKMSVWARATPDNCKHKLLLLKAEYAVATGKTAKATKFYKEAVSATSDSGFVQDEALTYERFGAFKEGEGDKETAARCLARSHQLYLTWGASAKADKLESEFPHLITHARGERSFQGFLCELKRRMSRSLALEDPSGELVPRRSFTKRAGSGKRSAWEGHSSDEYGVPGSTDSRQRLPLQEDPETETAPSRGISKLGSSSSTGGTWEDITGSSESSTVISPIITIRRAPAMMK